jgi:curli biogenesis system outer membrane secretion channel CsgG
MRVTSARAPTSRTPKRLPEVAMLVIRGLGLACAVAVLASIPGPAAAGPVGGPRKRIAVAEVEIKHGGVVAGTAVASSVQGPPGTVPSSAPPAPAGYAANSSIPSAYPTNPPSPAYPTDPSLPSSYPTSSSVPSSYPTAPSPSGYLASPPTSYPTGSEPSPSSAGGSYGPAQGSSLPGSAPGGAQGGSPAGSLPSSVGGLIPGGGGSVASSVGAGMNAFGIGSPRPASAPPPPPPTTTTLAPANVDVAPSAAAFGTGLTEMLTTALVKTERFIVLERKDLAVIRGEHALGADPVANAEMAARAGKLFGAQALVRAVVTEYGTSASASGVNTRFVPGMDLKRTNSSARVVVDVRIYDAETGQIFASEKAEGTASSSGYGLQVSRQDMNAGGSSLGQTPLGRAAREAIEKAVEFVVDKLAAVPWRGRIAEVDSGPDGTVTSLYLNAGSRVGLKKGDVLEAYDLGRAIVDPETGTVIGRTGGIVGKCRVEEVEPDMSTAVPVSGTRFQKGASVRFLTQS